MSYLFDHSVVMAHLRERIVGQDEALERVESALTIVQADISEKDKPLYAALFLGPTGVGKTETIRALSLALCGDVEAACRVDMNTLAQEHYSAALVGAPPGYVGSKEERTRSRALSPRPGSSSSTRWRRRTTPSSNPS
jgi:ATP-dependent Clp protease ATP-binding subunit ClpA